MRVDPGLPGSLLIAAENAQGKTMLIRIVSMLTKLGQRNCEVRENPGRYDHLDYDNDCDNDSDKHNDNGTKDSR